MKKILGGILIIFVIGLFAWRVYDVKANSFHMKIRHMLNRKNFNLEAQQSVLEKHLL